MCIVLPRGEEQRQVCRAARCDHEIGLGSVIRRQRHPDTANRPFRRINPQGVGLHGTQPAHRLGEAKGLVLVAGFAVADDEDLEGLAQCLPKMGLPSLLCKTNSRVCPVRKPMLGYANVM